MTPTTAVITTTASTTTAATKAESKSSIKSNMTNKRIVFDEDINQKQEIDYPQHLLIPTKRTPSIDSDTQSIVTTFSVSNTNSLSRILNRLRGAESIDSNKDFWMPDEQCRECFDCNALFNIFRRKHHCRTCGRIFCSKCLGNSIHTSHSLRVCNDCYLKFEIHKADDTMSIQDGYGYSSSNVDMTPQLQQQQHQQRTFLLPNDDDNSSDEEFERSTNSLEIQRPNIDFHFSQSTSSSHHQPVSDVDVGIKKLLTNTFLRTTPRSRTSTMNSLGIDTSLATLEGRQQQQQQQQLNSPMPFRRNSFIASGTSAHPDTNHGFNAPHVTNVSAQGSSIHHLAAEYYEVEDDDSRRWDKNPRNLLNFLGGERPASGIFTNIPTFFDEYPDSPTISNANVTPMLSSSTSTTKASWFMRSNTTANERSNSIIRRRLSLSDSGNANGVGFTNTSNNGNGGGGISNSLVGGNITSSSSTRHIRVRTKSLMRNTPITTASIRMENSNQSSSSGNESSGSVNIQYGTSPSFQHQHVSGRSTTPDLDHVRNQILTMTSIGEPTCVKHEQWDESSIYLMRNILRHLLEECGVRTKSHKAWEDVMMKLLLTIADEVQPHIRVKDSFNMNHYVKIKKIPGGLPKDSFSISGVVLSKNVVHKDMIRKIENPRILILNFDLDGFSSTSTSTSTAANAIGNNDAGARKEYLKFDRLLAWERDHMNALVDQIIGLKPSIVLIAANVSRTVIERLNKAKIVVAYNIKKQKLDAIVRCADATIFNYKNELWNAKSVPPGRCGMFETLTIMHEFLPNRRKTFLMFNQCPKERGATVLLRGSDLNTLYTIKYIMRFMVTVVNNINLEAQLRQDFVDLRRWNLPVMYDYDSLDEDENGELRNSHEDDSSTLLHYSKNSGKVTNGSLFADGASVDTQAVETQSISALSVAESQVTVNTVDVNASKKRSQQQFQHDTIVVEDDDICLTAINTVLKQYHNTTLSISPGVTLPVPHILLKLREAQKKLIGLIRERLGSNITGTVLATTSGIDAIVCESEKGTANKSAIPPIPIDLMAMPFYLKSFDIYLEHDLEYRHFQDLHLQAWYVFKKHIDGIHQHLSPLYHQEILVHRTTNPMNNHAIPCEKAVLETYNYYDPSSDSTLGQYIISAVKEAYTKCGSKICEGLMIDHDRTYSHGNAQIKVQVLYELDNGEEEPVVEERIDISRDEQLRKIHISFRTKCHICKVVHSWKPISDLMQRYSFGKFMELLFYQSDAIPLYGRNDEVGVGDYFTSTEDGDISGCPHGLYRDHTLSFRIQNLSVNFTHAMVRVVEVQPPSLHLRYSPKQQIMIKDASLDSTRSKIAKFFDSIIERNKNFSYDIVQPNMIDTCKEHLQEMSQEALKNKKNLLQKLQSEYATSAPTDTLQLNNVLAELQNHAVNWDLKYIDLARRFVRPERELRRLTTNHLRKMFPAESLYNSNNVTPVVSNLNLRTKRAIEAADLPLLDVGLDTSSAIAPYGISNRVDDIDTSLTVNLTLKEQPSLGESPTESYPWFDELKRFDQMFMQSDDQSKDVNKNSTNDKRQITTKKHSTDSVLLASSPSSPRDTILDEDTKDLDPSVARRLSLELMKDAPKKKKEQVEDKKQQKQKQQRYLEKSDIVETRKSPSAPPPSPMTSSISLMTPTTRSRLAPGNRIKQPEAMTHNASNNHGNNSDNNDTKNNSSRLIRHAAALPMLSSTAYKRLAGLLPDPMVGKSKSSPSPGNNTSAQQQKSSSRQRVVDHNQNKAANRKSQFFESSSNLFTAAPTNANNNTISSSPLAPPPAPPAPPKVNFYRGSPYAAKLQDRSSIAYRYGFMGPPTTNSPPILPVIDKKLGLNTHISANRASNNNNTREGLITLNSTTSSSMTQALIPSIVNAQDAVARPRSRTMAIVGGVSTGNLMNYQQNLKASGSGTGVNNVTNRGRIPVLTSAFNHGTLDKPSGSSSSTAMIKFSNNIGIGLGNPSHLPIPIHHHYHHGRKLSEGKIRDIRQRLPSKASLEPYTKIKEIIANHDESSSSSEDETLSDDDDDDHEVDDDGCALSEDEDELLPFQHKTFSLMFTDEYDESLGRELVPSMLELEQFNREHQLQIENSTLPYLSVDCGMVGENSRKSTHDVAGFDPMTKTLSGNAIMEAVLQSTSSLNTGSSSASLDWSPGVSGKNSIMKAITYVLAEKSISNLQPLEYPFSPTEHIFADSNILVREDEPSSIISYMLGSTFYNEKLHRKRELRMSKATASNNLFDPNESDKEKTESSNGVADQLSTSQNSHQETKPFFLEMFPETDERERPWKFSFKGGSTSFTCKIYFAEQFDMLRKSCGCDEIFISSLARCTTWDTAGGKSGSTFLKTKDERFLIKQISKYEMDAFLGSANKYFLYMFNEVFDKGIPTVLCKIFGLYRIGFYNNASGKSMKMDILVMENLFYDTAVKEVYDLKGSMRNRYAEKTGKDVEVYLDENLVEIISKTPLYMRVDTKYNLSDSLFNDTQFLLNLDVMDYSLLVGFDEDTNEIIVGIVDFIRTFTWDKKLESWVKESGMLGGGKKEPTIVSPRMYRRRFRSAIDLYFCMIPDFWTLRLE
ncbi:unnamed protein product [Mucor hiemalis]